MSRPLLLVDVGNSRFKWALATSKEMNRGASFATHSPQLSALLDQYWSNIRQPRAVIVSNVAGPDLALRIDEWIAEHWGVPVFYPKSEPQHGPVINGYRKPEQLGVDRWLGLLGLQHDYPLPACLVDCGTAITLDLLDSNARHQGGLIAPGLETMRRSLQINTHGLGPSDGGFGLDSLGYDTKTAIQSGCLLACAGLVEKLQQRLLAQIDQPVSWVLTGGNAGLIAGRLSMPIILDRDIVLRGLWVWGLDL